MLGLPKSTEFNRRIPKQKFYENLTISSALMNAVSGLDDFELICFLVVK